MIIMTDAQGDAVSTEVGRVFELALAVTKARDLTSMRKGLLAVRMATINAVQVINDIEADIRTRGNLSSAAQGGRQPNKLPAEAVTQ